MKLLRVHYLPDGGTVSNEVLDLSGNTLIGKLFTDDPRLDEVLFTKVNGEEILWSRWPTE